MNDLDMVTTIEDQVLALIGISVELTAEGLLQWTTAYKEDRSYVAAYLKLRQDQKHVHYYLNPSGLLASMMGGQQKIIIPKSLQQQI